jgi:hypothetical protein
MVNSDQAPVTASDGKDSEEVHDRDDIYKPSGALHRKRWRWTLPASIKNALSSLLHQDPSRPHIEPSSGLGTKPALPSYRACEIQRMTEFEEVNFTPEHQPNRRQHAASSCPGSISCIADSTGVLVCLVNPKVGLRMLIIQFMFVLLVNFFCFAHLSIWY